MQASLISKQCFPIWNEIFKILQLCFIIHISKMNALKIFFPMKLEPFLAINYKTEGHFVFLLREKDEKTKHSWNPVHKNRLIFSK